MKKPRRSLITLVIVLLASLAMFFALPSIVDQQRNSVYKKPTTTASASASESDAELHRELFVADMHADTLLWNRDLLVESKYGHVDIPRMIKGHMALQIFSIVTKTPPIMNLSGNSDRGDNITLLAIAQRWPLATWNSLSARALYQAQKLHAAAARSRGEFRIILTRQDLLKFFADRKSQPALTAGLISVEGSQALEGDLSKLETLYGAGVRMIAPTHFFDTEFAGSAHGLSQAGLSALGLQWLYSVEKNRMLVDLAHASAKTIEDVLAKATRPVVISHTGVKAICDNNRNLSDEQLRALAAKGALVGIGFWEEASCDRTLNGIVRSIQHAVQVMGVEHVALGSDFDGFVSTPIDTSRMGELTQALERAGLTHEQIRLIMGENLFNFLLKNLS